MPLTNGFRAGSLLCLLLLLGPAPPVWAQSSNQPIPGIDVVVQKKPSGGTMRIPLDRSGDPGRLALDGGDWSIELQCRGGGGCRLPAFTALSIDGRRYVLPGPGQELELRLGSAPGDRDVRLEIQPINGIGGTGGGRYTFLAERSGDTRAELNFTRIDVEYRAPPSTARATDTSAADPHGLGDAGHDSGGGGGGGAGGAGAP